MAPQLGVPSNSTGARSIAPQPVSSTPHIKIENALSTYHLCNDPGLIHVKIDAARYVFLR